MTVNTEVKGTLARLLATENLVVEHRSVQTASFDVNSRVLTLPIWKEASGTVYDLLVGHEVGHALYTPNIPIDAPKGFVNVIEDARIERLMKQTYPGLRRTFFDGYKELWHKDFFGVADEDINELAFIDRINLYFKGNSELEFTDEESVWINRVATTKTFDDVLELSRELYEWAKSKEDQKAAELPQQMEVNWDSPSAGNEIDQEFQPEEGSEKSEPNNKPISEMTDEELLDELEDKMYEDDSDPVGGEEGGVKETESITDKALQESLETLVGGDDNREWVYLDLPKIDLDEVVITHKQVQEDLTFGFYGGSFYDKRDHDYYFESLEYADSHYKQYKKEAQKSVNYLVKQFEMKKSADEYKRAATSKTGVIDTQSLYKYKLSDDIFRRVTVIPEGKNHGLIFFLDWSGSMCHNLLDTIKQTYNLVWFCRKAGIPFRVYAFQNGWDRGSNHPAIQEQENVLAFCNGFRLFEFFSSRQNAKSLDKSMKLVYFQAFSMNGYRLRPVEKYGLGGTPLSEAVLCSRQLVDLMKAVEKVQKVNVVCLTDGESNQMQYTTKTGEYSYYNYDTDLCTRNLRSNVKYILRDSKTGYSREISSSPYLVTKEIVGFFREITDYNWIGIRICQKNEFKRTTRILSYAEAEEAEKQWSKYRYASIKKLLGYTEAFFMPIQNMGDGTQDLEVKQKGEVATRAELNRAFKKHMGSKMTNKTVLNKFVEQIA